jgi:hypothetical protein
MTPRRRTPVTDRPESFDFVATFNGKTDTITGKVVTQDIPSQIEQTFRVYYVGEWVPELHEVFQPGERLLYRFFASSRRREGYTRVAIAHDCRESFGGWTTVYSKGHAYQIPCGYVLSKLLGKAVLPLVLYVRMTRHAAPPAKPRRKRKV